MVDYNKMYVKLFNSVTDAIEILQKAQVQTEDIFIDSETEIIQLQPDDDNAK